MSDVSLINTIALTMSSREIAELCDKEHRNVVRDIRAMLAELHGNGGVLSFEHTQTNPQNGQSYPVFMLPKRETLILVSGYNLPMRAKIIDRWQELESKSAAAIPNFGDPVAAARAWADSEERRVKEQQLRLESEARQLTLQARVQYLEPKADALDLISADDKSLTITQACKVLGVKREQLTTWLSANGWVYRQNGSWVAYQQHIHSGRLTYKEARYTDENTGQEVHRPYCHITPKGLARLAVVFGGDAKAA